MNLTYPNSGHKREESVGKSYNLIDNFNPHIFLPFADEEEADGEELFGDNMEQDYRPMPGLDRYDPGMLDDDPDNDLGPMSESDRAAAEAALRRRDREEGRRVRGMRRGLLYDDESDDEVG